MSRFADSSNTQARSAKARQVSIQARIVKNAAGGNAFVQSDKLALASLVLSNMLSGDMYRSQDEVLTKIQDLVKSIEDKAFVAKTALYARNEFGMRTTSQVLAGELATLNATSGTSWGRDFYNAIIYRVDDMMEILGYYLEKNKDKPLPNALKAGFAEAFKRFDAYQLAKYKGDTRAVKLVDVVRLVRPKPSERNAAALAQLLKGELKNTQTWEAKISAAGHIEDEGEKEEARNEAWASLLKENKLGYLALVRNLNNIAVDTDDEAFKLAIAALTNKDAIEKSKVFPFQLFLAYKEVEAQGGRSSRSYGDATKAPKAAMKADRKAKIMDALSEALDIACVNVPHMDGKTLVAIDNSGSMSSGMCAFSKTNAIDIATLFGVILAKANDSDVVFFNDQAKFVPILKSRSTLDTVKMLANTTGGTSFESIFDLITKEGKKYDRIFVLSDMEAWIQSSGSPVTMVNTYKSRVGANPFIYSFDLTGNGTMQFKEISPKTIALAGFSEKIFDIMKLAEMDKNALVEAIENYPIQVVRKNKNRDRAKE